MQASWADLKSPEQLEPHELTPTENVFEVSKISVGALRESRLTENVRLGLGALYSFNRVADELRPSYDGNPEGAMVFLQFTAGT
jgi:hypothetical protein